MYDDVVMIRIGDFARLTGVSIVTLRHYDDEGILQPVFVREETGYRYYSVEQMADVRRILGLRQLGFSLEEIRDLLANRSDPREFADGLRAKRQEAKERLDAEIERLIRIDLELMTLDQGDEVSAPEIEAKTAPSLRLAISRIEIPTNDQAGDILGRAYSELADQIMRGSGQIVGPAMALWHTSPEDLTNEVVDVAFPVANLPAESPIATIELPKRSVASAMFAGPLRVGLRRSHVALSEWLAANHQLLDGPYIEIYHDCQNPDQAVAEVQYPLTAEERKP